ncbi:MAG TPA: hypothetical protein VN456_07720 [Desulfosporosinus sp.]|nr:hypothetical protein [Desulfosporosinus sp.]
MKETILMKVSLYIFALIIAIGLLSLVDLPALLKKKDYRELFVVVSLFGIGFIMNFLLIIGAQLPNPNKLITTIIQVFLK